MDLGTDATISGISGTAAAAVPVTVTGVASYAGGFSLTYLSGGATNASWNARGAFSTDIDFASGVLLGAGTGNYSSSLTVAGTLDGTHFNGFAQILALEYAGSATVPMSGGLYGTNTVAGVYQGATVT